jgi:hypothetical protein
MWLLGMMGVHMYDAIFFDPWRTSLLCGKDIAVFSATNPHKKTWLVS